MKITDQDWQIRHFIYTFFVANERPPTVDETAEQFAMTTADARTSYQRLNTTDAIALDGDSDSIRIAKPLSAVPTAYRVLVNGRHYYANCAWDALGVPAMLHADAVIEADTDGTDEPVGYAIENGEVRSDGGIIHTPFPFRRWFEDIVHT